MRRSEIIILLILISSQFLWSQNTDSTLFYHGRHYGSEANVHPVRLILNGGFGILQMDNRNNRLDEVDFKNGFDNVWENLSDPIAAVREEGYFHFIRTQMIPISFDEQEAYYWPNYTLHMIGGGMSYRMMEDWYKVHRFPHPKLNALLTLTVYHLLNEVVENSDYRGYNTDAIADFYIFNPLGVLLFSSDKVARFFSHTLNMNDWSYQPSYNPWDNQIQNHGQNFVMKYFFNKNEDIGIFYHFGTHGEIGLSFKRSDGSCISFGAGLVAGQLVDRSNRQDLRELTAELVLTAGVFYDRNNSLMASILYSKKLDDKLRVNIYPGLIKIMGISPGFFVGFNQKNQMQAGISFSIIPIGLARNF